MSGWSNANNLFRNKLSYMYSKGLNITVKLCWIEAFNVPEFELNLLYTMNSGGFEVAVK